MPFSIITYCFQRTAKKCVATVYHWLLPRGMAVLQRLAASDEECHDAREEAEPSTESTMVSIPLNHTVSSPQITLQCLPSWLASGHSRSILYRLWHIAESFALRATCTFSVQYCKCIPISPAKSCLVLQGLAASDEEFHDAKEEFEPYPTLTSTTVLIILPSIAISTRDWISQDWKFELLVPF